MKSGAVTLGLQSSWCESERVRAWASKAGWLLLLGTCGWSWVRHLRFPQGPSGAWPQYPSLHPSIHPFIPRSLPSCLSVCLDGWVGRWMDGAWCWGSVRLKVMLHWTSLPFKLETEVWGEGFFFPLSSWVQVGGCEGGRGPHSEVDSVDWSQQTSTEMAE